jgi:hypothetical protein
MFLSTFYFQIQKTVFMLMGKILQSRYMEAMLGGVPVPTAWRVLGLRMEERPPVMEVSCEYIE